MNKDGKITFIELKVGLRKMEKDFLDQMFDIFDRNGDDLRSSVDCFSYSQIYYFRRSMLYYCILI